MKVCGKCLLTKELTEFAWRNKKRNWYQSWCRSCVQQNDQTPTRKKQKLDANKIGMARRKIDGIKQIIAFLQAHPCIDCGETDVLVLDFDHRDGSTKEADMGTLIALGYSWEALQKEMEKCDIRCSNCHRRKTAQERNTLRWRYSRPIPSGEGPV